MVYPPKPWPHDCECNTCEQFWKDQRKEIEKRTVANEIAFDMAVKLIIVASVFTIIVAMICQF